MAKYTRAFVFTKRTNLLPYFYSKADGSLITERSLQYYGRERDVELVAMFRYECKDGEGKCLCNIKCPINPLPIKGEFETPDSGAVLSFLKENGWTLKQKLYPHMFD